MKKHYLIALIVLGALSLWMLSGVVGGDNPLEKKKIIDAAGPLTVQVINQKAQPVWREVTFSGRTMPARQVTLRAETSGQVVELGAERGTFVEKGDLIVLLDMRNRKQLLVQAKAVLKQRELEYDAATRLAQKGFQAETKVAEALARLETARSDLQNIEQDISYTRIIAPFAGKLQSRQVEVGDYVIDGDTVGEVLELEPMIISGEITEREVAHLKTGMPGRAKLASGEIIEGKVRYIAAEGDATSRTFLVELAVDNPGSKIPSGVTAEVKVMYDQVLAQKASANLLTLDDQGKIGIKALNDDDVVEFYPATIVRSSADELWLSGLPEEIRMISRGQGFVRMGEKVNVAPLAPSDEPNA